MSQVTQKQFTEFRAELKSDINRLENRLENRLDGEVKALNARLDNLSSNMQRMESRIIQGVVGLFIGALVLTMSAQSLIAAAVDLAK